MNGTKTFLQAAFRYITWAPPSIWRRIYFFNSFNILFFPLDGVSVGPSWCCGVISAVLPSLVLFFFLVALRLSEWWVTMNKEVCDPRYCINVLMFENSMSFSCIDNLFIFFGGGRVCFCFLFFACFVFAQHTDLCFDTVTLKKIKLYKVKGEWGWFQVAFL